MVGANRAEGCSHRFKMRKQRPGAVLSYFLFTLFILQLTSSNQQRSAHCISDTSQLSLLPSPWKQHQMCQSDVNSQSWERVLFSFLYLSLHPPTSPSLPGRGWGTSCWRYQNTKFMTWILYQGPLLLGSCSVKQNDTLFIIYIFFFILQQYFKAENIASVIFCRFIAL